MWNCPLVTECCIQQKVSIINHSNKTIQNKHQNLLADTMTHLLSKTQRSQWTTFPDYSQNAAIRPNSRFSRHFPHTNISIMCYTGQMHTTATSPFPSLSQASFGRHDFSTCRELRAKAAMSGKWTVCRHDLKTWVHRVQLEWPDQVLPRSGDCHWMPQRSVPEPCRTMHKSTHSMIIATTSDQRSQTSAQNSGVLRLLPPGQHDKSSSCSLGTHPKISPKNVPKITESGLRNPGSESCIRSAPKYDWPNRTLQNCIKIHSWLAEICCKWKVYTTFPNKKRLTTHCDALGML